MVRVGSSSSGGGPPTGRDTAETQPRHSRDTVEMGLASLPQPPTGLNPHRVRYLGGMVHVGARRVPRVAALLVALALARVDVGGVHVADGARDVMRRARGERCAEQRVRGTKICRGRGGASWARAARPGAWATLLVGSRAAREATKPTRRGARVFYILADACFFVGVGCEVTVASEDSGRPRERNQKTNLAARCTVAQRWSRVLRRAPAPECRRARACGPWAMPLL